MEIREDRRVHKKYRIVFGSNTAYRKWLTKGYRKSGISQKIHGEIMKDFAYAIIDLMLYKNFEFKMPYRLGYLYMHKIKNKIKLTKDGELNKKSLIIDYGASYKMWKGMYPELTRQEIFAIPNKKYVYHLNEHTDGYVIKVYWDKTVCRVKNQRVYSFKLMKTIRLYTAKVIKENPNLDFYIKKEY